MPFLPSLTVTVILNWGLYYQAGVSQVPEIRNKNIYIIRHSRLELPNSQRIDAIGRRPSELEWRSVVISRLWSRDSSALEFILSRSRSRSRSRDLKAKVQPTTWSPQADHSCYQKTRNPLHANPMQLLYVLSKRSPTMEPCTFRYLLPRTWQLQVGAVED